MKTRCSGRFNQILKGVNHAYSRRIAAHVLEAGADPLRIFRLPLIDNQRHCITMRPHDLCVVAMGQHSSEALFFAATHELANVPHPFRDMTIMNPYVGLKQTAWKQETVSQIISR